VINLIKLCVGVKSISHLEELRKERALNGQARADGLIVHRTRMMPKRRDEIINKGSLFWVIAGKIQCRQKIVDLEEIFNEEGKKYCNIIMEKEIVRTIPQPKRAFQGWRYLPKNDAPKDLDILVNEDSEKIIADLAQLGLI